MELDFQTIYGTICLVFILVVTIRVLNNVTDFDVDDMLGHNQQGQGNKARSN